MRWGEREREREWSQLLVYVPNLCSREGWATLKPGPRNSIPHMWQGLNFLCISKKLDRKWSSYQDLKQVPALKADSRSWTQASRVTCQTVTCPGFLSTFLKSPHTTHTPTKNIYGKEGLWERVSGAGNEGRIYLDCFRKGSQDMEPNQVIIYRWIKKMWFICMMEYYSDTRRTESLYVKQHRGRWT